MTVFDYGSMKDVVAFTKINEEPTKHISVLSKQSVPGLDKEIKDIKEPTIDLPNDPETIS